MKPVNFMRIFLSLQNTHLLNNMQSLITIKTFTYPHEAYVIRGKLESEGIETFMRDEMTVQVHNFYSNAVGGVKLQVREKDADHAREILGLQQKETQDVVIIKKTAIENENTCPFCGSENLAKGKKANWLTLIPYVVVGFIFPVYKKSFTCFDCSKQWMLK